MAVAGSGGWVPSCRVVVREGALVATGHVTNKPAEIVYSDEEKRAYGTLADACDRLARKEPIQVDMTNGQFIKLVGMWAERTAERPLPEWAA